LPKSAIAVNVVDASSTPPPSASVQRARASNGQATRAQATMGKGRRMTERRSGSSGLAETSAARVRLPLRSCPHPGVTVATVNVTALRAPCALPLPSPPTIARLPPASAAAVSARRAHRRRRWRRPSASG
jgi:hypothetical protein